MSPTYDLKAALPVNPWLLVFLAGFAGLVFVLTYRIQRSITPARRKLLTALRLASAAILVFCLLQPFLRKNFRETRPNHVAVVLDISQSMSIPDGADDKTRHELALAAAAQIHEQLDKNFVTHLYFMGSETAERKTSALEGLGAHADRTDMIKALETIAGDLEGERLAAVFLLTDGGHNTGGDWSDVETAYTAGEAPIPVYPITFGSARIADLEVSDVRVKRTVTISTLLKVTARVRAQGLTPENVPVKIVRLRDGKPTRVVEQKAVRISPEKPEGEVVFEFLPDGEGYLEYAVAVDPLKGEIVRDNNVRPFAVTVNRRKLKVLYMEGTKTRLPDRELWEHQYLEEALKEDNIEYRTMLRADKPEDKDFLRDAGFPWVTHPTKGFPRTKRELYKFDVIISSDIPISKFSKKQRDMTVDFVGKFGGGFVMIGGWKAFGPGEYDESVIDKMLPVDMIGGEHESYKEGEDFQWIVTEEGLAHPIMTMDQDADKNRAIWEDMPDFHGYNMVQRAKPAATVLAVHPEDGNLYSDNYVMIAVQQFGRGRSMAFATDTTYGWGSDFETDFGEDDPDNFENDARHFKRFWQNSMRWLAQYRLTAPSTLAYIELDKNLYARGSRARVRVRVLTPEYEPTHDAQVKLVVRTPDGDSQEIKLEKQFDTPGLYTREIPMKQVGRHELQLEAFLRGEKIADDQVMVYAREANLEFENFALNTKLLNRLAYQTGGKTFTGADAKLATSELQETTHLVVRHTDRDIWDRWWWLTLVLGLLSMEWFLRKRAGLP
jgi:uncharacterized membrane protein